MNPKLIQFIELCLVDGVISDKEREVIFRKSKEYGVPDDECEIILEGMIQKYGKKSSNNGVDEDELKDSITPTVSQKDKEKSKVKNEIDIKHNKKSPNHNNKSKVSVSEDNSDNDSIKEKLFQNERKDSKLKGEEGNITEEFPSKTYDSIYSFSYDFSSNFVKNYYQKNKSNPSLLDKTEVSKYDTKVFTSGPYSHYGFELNKQLVSHIEFAIHQNKTWVIFNLSNITFIYKGSDLLSEKSIELSLESLFKMSFPNEEKKSNVELIDMWMRSRQFPTTFGQDRFSNKIISFSDSKGLAEWENNTNYNPYQEIKLKEDVLRIVIDFLKSFVTEGQIYLKEKNRIEHINERERLINERERLRKVKSNITQIYKEFDKDNNGIIDVVEGSDDFMILFKKHQSKIIEVDKKYIQNFVKISNYLKDKRKNIQDVFSSIKKIKNQSKLDENIGILKNQIHTYELVLFHSLNMITSIIEDDLIIFYEIYESFDKLNMFNSNWENEVSQQLENIGDGLSVLMYSINSMERNIVGRLNKLSYVTQEGFSNLNNSVTRELQSIDSSIKFNNLLTGIQTYQMYKINKNTKGLRG